MKKILKLLINLLFILILILSSISLYIKLYDYKKADEIYSELRENTNNNKNRHEELYSKNNDYRFWIKIDNTNINYPVVQGNDNDFYLTHDFYKEPLSSGSIFMDYRNNFEYDRSIIIYGHHMKNKSMFADIDRFNDEAFFKENNLIEIEFKGNTYIYEVFSVYTADLLNKDYLKTHFNNDDEFRDYLNYITGRSLYKSDINVTVSDKIITLYTCSYKFEDARTLIHAKLISKR